MLLRYVRIVLAAAVFLTATRLQAQAYVAHEATFTAVRAAAPLALDPSLSDPAWQKAFTATDFYNFTARRPAALKTTAYVLYDEKNLYVAFRCVQSGVPISATQNVDHAGVLTDDHVTVLIDTSGNGSRSYDFRSSPKGVHDESSTENSRYTPVWQSAAKVLPNGDYNVMMIIPLSNLRSEGGPTKRWRINFVRFIAATSDEYTWAYEPQESDPSNQQDWPVFTGLHIASTATRPKPYADVYALQSGGSQRAVFQNGIGQFEPMNPRPLGVDVTYPFTNTLAFVGTLNPDFSNVEQDQATIAPQEFQVFYNEYRPFFAQGAGFINSLPNVGLNGPSDILFYTPSIGIFNRGLKVEGTAGRNAIGVLNAIGAGFDDTAFGYKYVLPDNSFSASAEGVLARHTDLSDNVAGIGLGQTNPHSGEFTLLRYSSEAGTLVTDLGAAHSLLTGGGIQTSRFLALAFYKDVSPEFNPVDGFTQANDERGPQGLLQYNGTPAGNGPVKSYQLTALADRYVDGSGAVHQADVAGIFNVTFKNQISLNGFAGPSEFRFYDQGFPDYTNGQTFWFNRRSLGIGYKDGTSSPIDVSYAWGPFNGQWVQQFNSSMTRTFGLYGISLEFDGNIERAGAGAPISDSQWLRRISLTRAFGRNATLAVGLRSINGTGGFAEPGTNIAISYSQRFPNQDLLYLVYGTPAAPQTLHRLIAKYVFHIGGASGT